jgi:hypothetical protein
MAVGAYWYWSPLVAIHQMREAAKAGDADAFNDHVDYPKLRESMKGQLSAMVTKKLATEPQSHNEFAKAGAALGAMLGLTLVDKLVDAFVRPETVMQAMQQGKMMPKRQPDAPASSPTPTTSDEKVTWQSERKGVDKYIAYVMKPGQPEDQRIGLVMERSGFANWKLTEIRLPAAQ